MDFVVSGRKYISKLPLEKLLPFYLRRKERPLPSNFKSEKFNYETDESKENVLNLTRNMSNVNSTIHTNKLSTLRMYQLELFVK